MARLIERNGLPIAVLIEDPGGNFIVPPIVFDESGALIQGHEVLAAISQTGNAIEVPVVRNCPPGFLADLDQFLETAAAQLNATVGFPEELPPIT